MGTKNIEIERQTAELEIHRGEIQNISRFLADLKAEIAVKNDVIVHQDATLEAQRMEIQQVSKKVSNLEFEIETKNGEIAKQDMELKIHHDEIQRLSNCLANLKTEIGVNSGSENLSKNLVDENAKADKDDSSSLELYLNLMCFDEPKMDQLEERLAKVKIFIGLKTNFCDFGSDCDLKTFIVGMIDRIMSKDLQKKFSWSGKRTGKQGVFTKYTRINDLVHFCCKANFGKYKVAEGEQILQKLFQTA
ncbi:uncharacterized protein LOC119075685 [Bradysia coprophila]|uniref:uncharacterized protein LOC119075685 n=1 Tax=Bradysia coprophila TaxID=38358 RepID=UPI00187D811D|nr:uncharacterized protein LOC119075685 [Bradysia coprophila]